METGQLHQLINQMEWSQVLHVIRNDPSARSAAKELFRENAPLHTACEKKAPEIVLIELLELNADALQHVGKGGTLPLHIAAQKNLGPKVIEKMIRLYPAALDYKNIANYTPREYEQKDPLASQALNRPTYCWKQFIKDESREEEQDCRLGKIQERVESGFQSLSSSDAHIDEMMTRLQYVEKKLRDLEGLKSLDLEETVTNLKASVGETMNKIESRLDAVENDIEVAKSRDYISRAATRAHQNDVLKMQKVIAEESNKLKQDLSNLAASAV